MKGFFSMLKMDGTVILRNGFIAVVLVLAVIYALMVNFLLPEEIRIGAKEYVVDETQSQAYRLRVEEAGKSDLVLQDREKLMETLDLENTALGIVFTEDKITIIQQGYEQEENINLLKASLNSLAQEIGGLSTNVKVTYKLLTPEREKIPFNKLMIPLLLATDITVLGFVLIAVMVFQEKKEGGIRAYCVSPGSSWTYVLSKISVNSLLSLTFAYFFVFLTLGLDIPILHFTILIFFTSFLVSSLGLLIGQFYDSISDFLFVTLLFFVIVGLPGITYFFPYFDFQLFKLLPSHPLLFASKELLFAGSFDFFRLEAMLLAECLIILLITVLSVEKNLLRRCR